MSWTTDLSTDTFNALAETIGGAAFGILTWQLIDIGSWWPEQLVSFLIGAIPGAIVVGASLSQGAGGVNRQLLQGSLAVAQQNLPIFLVCTIGMTTIISLCYQIFIAPEIDVFAALLPFVSLKGIDIAIMWMGLMAGVMFAGIAGWPLECIQWALYDDCDPTTKPAKPGGRTVHSIWDAPKDFMYFIFAAPIAVVDTLQHAIGNLSIVPFFFLPLKIALDQWTRMGDLICDIMPAVENTISAIEHDAYRFFDAAWKDDVSLWNDIFGHKSTPPAPVAAVTVPYDPSTTPAGYWLKYPLLFSDNDNELPQTANSKN